jgi:hypothetical protein
MPFILFLSWFLCKNTRHLEDRRRQPRSEPAKLKTTYIQHFSGELKFTAIACIFQDGLIVYLYNEPTPKLVEPSQFDDQK